MYSKTIIAATITALFASSAIGASVAQPEAAIGRAAMIAPDPDNACNCPNNCRHKNGDSCAFYRDGNTVRGECQHAGEGGRLLCIG